MTPGNYDFAPRRRGDTFRPHSFTLTTGGESPEPISVSAARLQVRTSTGRLVQEWTSAGDEPTLTIDGGDAANVLTMTEVSAAITATWCPGVHAYDLEVTTNGKVRTILAGTFQIDADTTR